MSVKIEGLDALTRRLKQFPVTLQRRALGNAMRAGAREIAREVKARAPVDSGVLRRNIGTKRGRRQFDRGLVQRQIIGVKHGRTNKRGDPFYFRFQEKGYTAVGRRKAANRATRLARRLGFGNTGGRFIPGRKFLAGGLVTGEGAALNAIRTRLQRELDRL